MNTERLLRVREHGYWRILIRPTVFRPALISTLNDLTEAVQSSVVQIRGWDYPHWPQNGVERVQDGVDGSVDWEDHKEYWKAFRSGQFIHYLAMREDWLGTISIASLPPIPPHSLLDIENTIYTMTEIFRFASRWTRRLSLGPQVRIEVDVFGPKGRNLDSLDAPGVRFSLPKVGYDASFRFAEDFDPERLIGSADDLAMVPTRRLFELFAWDVPEENLVERQRRLLQRA